MCWYSSILSSFRGWNFSVKNFFIKYLLILRYCLYRKGRKKCMTLSLCLPVFRIMSLFLVPSKGEQWRFCFALSITMNSCILCQLGCLCYLTILSSLSWRLCFLAKRTIFSGLKPESLLLQVLTIGTYSWLFWPEESLQLLLLLTLLPPVCSWRVTWSQLTIWDFGIDLASS